MPGAWRNHFVVVAFATRSEACASAQFAVRRLVGLPWCSDARFWEAALVYGGSVHLWIRTSISFPVSAEAPRSFPSLLFHCSLLSLRTNRKD